MSRIDMQRELARDIYLYENKLTCSAEAIMRRVFCDDVYVFDMSLDGKIITARAPHERERIGESFLGYLSSDMREQLREYLFSYDMTPIVVDTSIGVAIVIPALMPSAALGIAVVPSIKRETILRLLWRIELCRDWISEELSGECTGRMTSDMKRYEEYVIKLVRDIEECFVDEDDKINITGALMNGRLEEKLIRFSDFVGCPVNLGIRHDIENRGKFDTGLYSAYVLVMLMFVRRISRRREATVHFDMGERCPYIEVVIESTDFDVKASSEYMWIRSVADRNNMIFHSIDQSDRVMVSFSPIIGDWSKIGVKSRELYSWMFDKKS